MVLKGQWGHVALLALAIIQAHRSMADYCPVVHTNRVNLTAPCSEFFDVVINQGYNLDREASGLDDLEHAALQSLLQNYILYPETSPDCVFYRSNSTTTTECCDGWDGPDCDDPMCDPSCENGGFCVEPYVCACVGTWTGLACQYDSSAVTTGETGYCYTKRTCGGDTVPGYDTPVLRDVCCELEEGRSWGIQLGECQACDDDMNMNMENPIVVPALPGLPFRTCMSYGPNVYRTFDGLQFCFMGRCSYNIYTQGQRSFYVEMIDCEAFSTCKKKYTLRLTDQLEVTAQAHEWVMVNDNPVVIDDKDGYANPAYPGLELERKGDYCLLEYQSIRFKWDATASWFLTIDMEDEDPIMEGVAIYGMCGNYDLDPDNDFTLTGNDVARDPTEFGNFWQLHSPDVCDPARGISLQCTDAGQLQHAEYFCRHLNMAPLSQCHDVVHPKNAFIWCVMDICRIITEAGPDEDVTADVEIARCEHYNYYSHECAEHGLVIDWRTPDLCPRDCPYGMTYTECTPKCMRTCSTLYSLIPTDCLEECFPGCTCDPGTYLHDGQCVEPVDCPCTYKQQSYPPGDVVGNDCNQCTCMSGQWQCTHNDCPRHCHVIGSMHFRTFDGLMYDYQGADGCEYILTETRPGAATRGILRITHRVVDCSGNMDYVCTEMVRVFYSEDGRTTTIIIYDDLTAMIQTFEHDITVMWSNEDIMVKQVTSMFAMIQGDGFMVLYDGQGRIYIRLEPIYAGQVEGQCANMDGDVTNELTTAGGVMGTVREFGDSFADQSCQGVSPEPQPTEPCEMQAMMSDEADDACAPIGNDVIFGACKPYVDWRYFRDNCIHDYCARDPTKRDAVVCLYAAALAYACMYVGVEVYWYDDFAATCADSSVERSNAVILPIIFHKRTPIARP